MTSTTTPASTVDAAAQASIGAAARELHLPTVRAEAVPLAEIAVRERQTHLAYLAEVLAAEVDERTGRRRTRRINDAMHSETSSTGGSTPLSPRHAAQPAYPHKP